MHYRYLANLNNIRQIYLFILCCLGQQHLFIYLFTKNTLKTIQIYTDSNYIYDSIILNIYIYLTNNKKYIYFKT